MSLKRTVRGVASYASALEWLYLAVGLGLVFRYRWIFDDAFIYYRYVDNLLFLDAGLTYNAGEFVEGFTSPLHCLVLVALRATHLSFPAISLGLGLGLFVVFWWLLVELGRAMGPERADRRAGGADGAGGPALNFPLAFLATNYSVTSFFTSGNETALLHVAGAAMALLMVRPASRWATLIVAMSPLVRPELALSLGLTMAFLWWHSRRFPTPLVLLSALVNGGWLLFRVIYYADFLPNTFYLKHGSNVTAGLRYLRDVIEPYHVGAVLAFFIGLAAVLALRARRRGESASARLHLAPRAAMLVVALSITAYVVRTGGSAMHYYYLAVPFTLVVCAVAGLLERGVSEWKRAGGHPQLDGRACGAMLLVTAWAFAQYPSNLDRHPVRGSEQMIQAPSVSVITDPSFHRRAAPRMKAWPDIADMTAFAPELRSDGYRRWTPSGWCDVVYERFRRRSVHAFGLTDGILARVDTPERQRGHKPALAALARDMIDVQRVAGAVDRGMYREAVERGNAPEWIGRNLESIERVERKMYNRHDFIENVRLALHFPPKIQLPPEPGAGS